MRSKTFVHKVFIVFTFSLLILTQLSAQKQEVDSIMIDSMNSLTNSALDLFGQGKYGETLQIGDIVLRYAEKHNNKELESRVCGLMGNAYYSIGKDSLCFEYLFRGLDLRIQLQDTVQIVISYNDIGVTYLEQGNKDKAKDYYQKALRLARQNDGNTAIIYPLRNMGDILMGEKNYSKALVYLEEAKLVIEGDEEYSSRALKPRIYADLTSLYQKVGDKEKSKEYLEKTITASKKGGFFEVLSNFYDEQAYFYADEKEYKKAYEFLDKHTVAYDTLQKIKEYKIGKQVEANNFLKENSEKLRLAKLENDLQEDATKKSQAYNLILGVISFLLLLSIFFFYRKNKQFKAAKEEAERLSRVKSDFYSEISHELRTPLYAVIELSRLLLKENVNPNHKVYLESLNFSGSHLLSLINNVLELNKVESGKMKLELVEFNLKNLLSNIIESIEYALNDSKNELHLKFDDKIPELLFGDSLKLSQVFINLISNAIKFTDKGNIYVKAKFIEDNADTVTVAFEVKDDGVGIPKDRQANIFEDFYQEGTKTKKSYKGTGLGLSIVKRFVTVMGSEIKVESEDKQGSIFSFQIEIFKSNRLHSKNLEEKNILKEIENKNILVVDDNKINQLVTKQILQQIGAKSTVKSSGEEAVESVLDEKFDCVLMDIHMPGLNGYETTELIRKFDKKIPVIALTAGSTDDIKLNIKKCGMNGFVLKPFLKADFIEAIYEAIHSTEPTSHE